MEHENVSFWVWKMANNVRLRRVSFTWKEITKNMVQ